jgi:hypothetical protein
MYKLKRVEASFALGKTVENVTAGDGYDPFTVHDPPSYDSWCRVDFTDGTNLVTITDHSGPYSEVTPDIDFSIGLYSIVPMTEDELKKIEDEKKLQELYQRTYYTRKAQDVEPADITVHLKKHFELTQTVEYVKPGQPPEKVADLYMFLDWNGYIDKMMTSEELDEADGNID